MDLKRSCRSQDSAGRRRLIPPIAALAVVVGLMASPGASLAAGGSTCMQYNPQTCNVVPPSTPTTPTPPTPPSAGSTPPPTTTPAPSGTSVPTTSVPTATSPGAATTAPEAATLPTHFTTATNVAAASKSSLPFTGLELGLIVAAGLGLIAGGFVVRMMARRFN